MQDSGGSNPPGSSTWQVQPMMVTSGGPPDHQQHAHSQMYGTQPIYAQQTAPVSYSQTPQTPHQLTQGGHFPSAPQGSLQSNSGNYVPNVPAAGNILASTLLAPTAERFGSQSGGGCPQGEGFQQNGSGFPNSGQLAVSGLSQPPQQLGVSSSGVPVQWTTAPVHGRGPQPGGAYPHHPQQQLHPVVHQHNQQQINTQQQPLPQKEQRGQGQGHVRDEIGNGRGQGRQQTSSQQQPLHQTPPQQTQQQMAAVLAHGAPFQHASHQWSPQQVTSSSNSLLRTGGGRGHGPVQGGGRGGRSNGGYGAGPYGPIHSGSSRGRYGPEFGSPGRGGRGGGRGGSFLQGHGPGHGRVRDAMTGFSSDRKRGRGDDPDAMQGKGKGRGGGTSYGPKASRREEGMASSAVFSPIPGHYHPQPEEDGVPYAASTSSSKTRLARKKAKRGKPSPSAVVVANRTAGQGQWDALLQETAGASIGKQGQPQGKSEAHDRSKPKPTRDTETVNPSYEDPKDPLAYSRMYPGGAILNMKDVDLKDKSPVSAAFELCVALSPKARPRFEFKPDNKTKKAPFTLHIVVHGVRYTEATAKTMKLAKQLASINFLREVIGTRMELDLRQLAKDGNGGNAARVAVRVAMAAENGAKAVGQGSTAASKLALGDGLRSYTQLLHDLVAAHPDTPTYAAYSFDAITDPNLSELDAADAKPKGFRCTCKVTRHVVNEAETEKVKNAEAKAKAVADEAASKAAAKPEDESLTKAFTAAFDAYTAAKATTLVDITVLSATGDGLSKREAKSKAAQALIHVLLPGNKNDEEMRTAVKVVTDEHRATRDARIEQEQKYAQTQKTLRLAKEAKEAKEKAKLPDNAGSASSSDGPLADAASTTQARSHGTSTATATAGASSVSTAGAPASSQPRKLRSTRATTAAIEAAANSGGLAQAKLSTKDANMGGKG